MGYDVAFQLINTGAVVSMLERLAAGRPPPPSAFDERPDADSWADARNKVLQGSAEQAVRAAGQLVAIWSAATLPYVSARNFGITYQPVRMEEELTHIPSTGFGSPELLFSGLPRTDLVFSGCLEGNGTIGGYVTLVDDAADAIAVFANTLRPNLRERVMPVMRILQAAQREKLTVLESTDLLYGKVAQPELLRWPGFDSVSEPTTPLTAATLAALAMRIADSPDVTERDDILNALTGGPLTTSCISFDSARPIIEWLEGLFAQGVHERTWRAYIRVRFACWGDPPRRKLDPAWIEAALETDDPVRLRDILYVTTPRGLEHERSHQPLTPDLATKLLRAYALAEPHYQDLPEPEFDLFWPEELTAFFLKQGASLPAVIRSARNAQDMSALPALLRDFPYGQDMHQFIASCFVAFTHVARVAEPTPELGTSLRELVNKLIERLVLDTMTPELAKATAGVWVALLDRYPSEALPLADCTLIDQTPYTLALDLLSSREPSERWLGAIAGMLSESEGWMYNEDKKWLEHVLQRHRTWLTALYALGAESQDASLRKAAEVLHRRLDKSVT